MKINKISIEKEISKRVNIKGQNLKRNNSIQL